MNIQGSPISSIRDAQDCVSPSHGVPSMDPVLSTPPVSRFPLNVGPPYAGGNDSGLTLLLIATAIEENPQYAEKYRASLKAKQLNEPSHMTSPPNVASLNPSPTNASLLNPSPTNAAPPSSSETPFIIPKKSNKPHSASKSKLNREWKEWSSDGEERGGEFSRPNFSYAQLAAQAIDASPFKKCTVSEIYSWIEDRYPYFRTGAAWWKNCIRHNLSMKKSFCRYYNSNGSHLWGIDPAYYDSLVATAHRTRRMKSSGNSGSNIPSSDQSLRRERPGSTGSLGDYEDDEDPELLVEHHPYYDMNHNMTPSPSFHDSVVFEPDFD